MKTITAWAILWRSENEMDGKQEYLLGTPHHPCRTLLFETRLEARDYIAKEYGYMRTRPDLMREPFGWKMPILARVFVTVGMMARDVAA